MNNFDFDPNKQTTNFLLNEILKSSGGSLSITDKVSAGLNLFDFNYEPSKFLIYEPIKSLVESVEFKSYSGAVPEFSEAIDNVIYLFLDFRFITRFPANDSYGLEVNFFNESDIVVFFANKQNVFLGPDSYNRATFNHDLVLSNLNLIRQIKWGAGDWLYITNYLKITLKP